MNPLVWCSEGSLDLGVFQDFAKVCVEHLVPEKVVGALDPSATQII